MSVVVVAPGQGAQTPGFLEPWLELSGTRETFEAHSAAASVDLVAHGTTSDADTIRDTAIAQPLIVSASIVVWDELRARTSAPVSGVAGHSVGEVAALAAAGVLDDVEAMRLVGVRGRAMAEAAAAEPTGMSAVIGGEETVILDALAALDLTPANMNGGGQIVAAGSLDALARLASNPPAGARVLPLQVAGAFHTRYMEPAVDVLRAAAAELAPRDPDRTLWTNRDGSIVTTGTEALALLVGQVANPVRWDLCMEAFRASGVTGIIELAPGGTLVGLAKRAFKGAEPPIQTVAIKTPDDLDAAVALLEGAA